jgi:hypothetical protein
VHNGSGFVLSRIAPAPLLPVRKPSLTVFGERSRAFIKYFRIEQIFPDYLVLDRIARLGICERHPFDRQINQAA